MRFIFAVSLIAFIFGMVFWLLVPLSSQTLKTEPLTKVEGDNDEQYALYSVLINDLFLKDSTSIESLNISNQTDFYENVESLAKTTNEERLLFLKQRFASVDEDLLADFDTKQQRPIELHPKFNLSIQYTLINAEELRQNEGYASKQMIKFSQIGFNQERTKAFVRIEYFCPLCGFGSSVLLEKQNGVWKIKQEFNSWMS